MDYRIFIVLLALLISWGWVLLGITAIALLFRKRLRWFRFPIAAVLLVLAFAWQQATVSYNFGEKHERVPSPSGHAAAYLMKTGMWSYHLVVECGDSSVDIMLRTAQEAEPPESISWVSNTVIRIHYPTDEDPQIDVGEYPELADCLRK